MRSARKHPFADPEKAALKLLELIGEMKIGVGVYFYTNKLNFDFLDAGGNAAEYEVGMNFAASQKWIDIDPSASRTILRSAGWKLLQSLRKEKRT